MRKNIGVSEVFLQDKPAKALIFLKKENKPVYQARISKEIGSTYAHTYNVLKELEDLRFVVFRKSGRIKLVKLTETGENVADALISFLDVAQLGEIERAVDIIYEKEIKGKLREEMNKEDVEKRLSNLKDKLKEYFENKPSNVSILARKLVKKINDVMAEGLGYAPQA